MKNSIDLKALLENKTNALQPEKNAAEEIEKVSKVVPENLMLDASVTEVTEPIAAKNVEMVANAAIRQPSIAEEKQREETMNAFINNVLISGTDYGVIPKCSKPSLLKPGAEKILSFLGFSAHTEVEHRQEDIEKGFFAYEAHVRLEDSFGRVVAEGLGCCNTREARYIKSGGFAVQNTALKMAKKRALIDAVLNAAAVSGVFTQDIEDTPLSDTSADDNIAFGKKVAVRSQRVNADNTTAHPASSKQLSYLESLMAQRGITAEALDQFTSEAWSIADYHDISSSQASELIEKFRNAVS